KPDAWVELARWEQQVWDVEPALSWLGAPSVRRPTAEQDSIAHLHAPVALASEVQQPPSSKTTDRLGLRAVTASGLCAPSGQRQATLGDRPLGLNLIGFAFGELGIGEDVRMAAAACAAVGIAFKVVNIHPGDQLRQSDRYLSDHVDANSPTEDEAPYAFNLFCLTGFDTVRVFLERGMSLFSGRYNIGWWPWELPVWPKQWDLAFDLVNEVWAATDFTYRTYSQASQRRARPPTVAWMPLPASIARVSKRTRAQLGLPHGKFLFLYVFDFNSYLARKNPLAALKAFRQAFAVDNNSVGLVFKTMNSQPDNPDWRRFEQSCAQDGRVVLMNQTLERGEVLGLIEACDAYVSLHRSEGFGRTLAEAMLLGKPVVGTNFSGNVDFLSETSGFPVKWRRRAVKPGDYPFVSASDAPWWAEPNIADAARQMQRAKMACADRAWVSRVTQLAQETFSPERIGNRMLARLQSIHAAQHS
ncbi:MAG: glycosyltransferase, partial [Rhodoferax sp.]|nr:glycosyltransferase [Rhodoferax sp.]